MKLLLDAAAARFARNDIPLYAADGIFRSGRETSRARSSKRGLLTDTRKKPGIYPLPTFPL